MELDCEAKWLCPSSLRLFLLVGFTDPYNHTYSESYSEIIRGHKYKHKDNDKDNDKDKDTYKVPENPTYAIFLKS